jgi:NAD(P)-dependent dehydrogenase (short-subunit alcohol dehydrogenase family)
VGERLAGRVAVITGAGAGIGREHALLMAREGASVVVNDNGVGFQAEGLPADAAAVVEEIRALKGSAVASTASAATAAGVAATVRLAVETFGTVDILVNNAGVLTADLVWRPTEADWDAVVDTTLKGYFLMIREVAPVMSRQGRGVVINTSSGSGLYGHPTAVAYAAGKEGVIGLTRSVAMELSRFGVRCNAIRPVAMTHLAETVQKSAGGEFMNLVSTARAAGSYSNDRPVETLQASRVASFVAWLCSDAAANVNGRTFECAGDFISLYAEQVPERELVHEGGRTLGLLEEIAQEFVGDLRNLYALEDYPELKVFKA